MIDLEIQLFVECEGIWVKGKQAFFDPRFGNYLPPERDYVEGFKVYLVKGTKRQEITEMLTDSEIDYLKDQFLAEESESA